VSDFKINKHFSFQPALYFVQKGGEEQSVDVNGNRNYKHTNTLNYFELPLNFVYSTEPSKTVFFIGAGPSLNLGLSGKIKIEAASEHSKEDIKFGGNDNRLKGF
jgi:hypothetical protein